MKKNSKYFKQSPLNPVAFKKQIEDADKKIQSMKIAFDHKYQALENFLTLIVNFASHDIKNTLHNLDGMISTLQPSKISEQDVEDMKMCVDHIRTTLIKFGEFSISNKDKEFELSKLFQNLEILHRPYFKTDKVNFEVEYSSNLKKDLVIYQDLQLLLFMFNNMVINSLTAVREMTIKRIKIFLSLEAENIEILFCDTGLGIPLNNKERIFEPYFTTRDGGTGVGLTHVKFVVETLLKSKIELVNITIDNFVTIFKIIIPIKSDDTQNSNN